MMDEVKRQKGILENLYTKTLDDRKNSLNESLSSVKDKDGKNLNIDANIYGESIIRENYNVLKGKMEQFDKDLYKIQKHKYRFQIAALVLFIILSIVGISGYWLRREYIPWIAGMFLFLLSSPVFAMAGLETTYTFLSIDFCSSVGNSIISGIIPSENKGLGTYLSCPSKDASRTLSTAIYQYIVNFNTLYKDTEEELQNLYADEVFSNPYTLGTNKRNNTHFEELKKEIGKENVEANIKKEITNKLNSIILMNEIMAGLLSMSSCLTAKNSINYIEDHYCYVNHIYMFRNVIFDMCAALGFIIISIGLNKLIITMKSHFARALRGKKEFNNDIIDEDDD